jgi:hypothetical protein
MLRIFSKFRIFPPEIQIRLYEQKVARPEAGLFGLLFGYFLVRSAATHSKMSLNQPKNPSLLPQAPSVHKVYSGLEG